MAIKPINFDASGKIGSSPLILSPISAVKELIDNAIDSGAKNIYIDIDEQTSGSEYIRVRDDGSGIDGAGRQLMCLNHTTSKISNPQEIAQVSTLGFRGQALFSLASLCKAEGSMEVITKCRKDAVGEKWFVNGDGSIKNSKITRIPYLQGTTLVLRRLFRGLRARHLKTSAKPFKQIGNCKTLIDHYSLDYRSIRFHFYLISLDKNGLVVKRELQQSHDTKFTKIKILSSIARLRNTHGHTFFEELGILIDRSTKIDVILPRMLPHGGEEDLDNIKKPKKFLSFNGRPLSLELSFGKSINELIDSLYHQLQLFDPMVWYLNLRSVMNIGDVNVEPEKNDVLIKDVDRLLNNMRRALLGHIMQELKLNVHKESVLTAEEQTKANSHSQIRRPLTAGSMVSNEGEWTHTLLDDDDINDPNSQDIQSSMDDLPSSLTYNYKETSFENEDLEISKELSISNPFMTAKLRRAFKYGSHNRHTNQTHSLPTKRWTSSPTKSKENFMDGHRPMNKVRKLDKTEKEQCEEFDLGHSLEDTTLVSAEEDQKDEEAILKRSIYNFSELTNNETTTEIFEIPHYSSCTYDQEMNWLSRRGNPSEWLTTYIRSRSHGGVYTTEARANH
ncbi:hypothetical protein ZYGR_0A03880 [Zygosaccharomyces rouxii]|uniref:ZYRO0A08800p n=2 Tax=Zygosaccharomyces rouxii TaxID=4956 RepID=C5DQ56_ZYGRC|nr:uncharacterized protein ZYRO0A08800g [Zygosaccharomyces rouxii]KAH9198664.1 hypothetical protein LQ764DRAFT_214339 [Zygosaccharomyces rouxii]GAV46792.1 hypothetical protein ZYGR_0A03880 [Zygosaccharomyces rouxii]CAR25817.1 ZYRO0A08800p [Zygosaccharomyces rouxii]